MNREYLKASLKEILLALDESDSKEVRDRENEERIYNKGFEDGKASVPVKNDTSIEEIKKMQGRLSELYNNIEIYEGRINSLKKLNSELNKELGNYAKREKRMGEEYSNIMSDFVELLDIVSTFIPTIYCKYCGNYFEGLNGQKKCKAGWCNGKNRLDKWRYRGE